MKEAAAEQVGVLEAELDEADVKRAELEALALTEW